MIKLWGVLRRRQRMVRQVTVSARTASPEDVRAAVDEICREFDIARPVWLAKHEGEMERFGRTAFSPDDFIETVAFDRFEVEILKSTKGKSSDPRNDFSY